MQKFTKSFLLVYPGVKQVEEKKKERKNGKSEGGDEREREVGLGWRENIKYFILVQIYRTKAESQQIVTQRSLSCVQYLVLYLSRIQRICLSRYLNLFFSIV